jgi:hypothetical protein
MVSLSFDELARRVGRRHLHDVLDEELKLGRVTVDEHGRYTLGVDLPRELVLALRGLSSDGSTMLEQDWPVG